MINLSKKRIILTGGAGFLGRLVEKKLIERGCSNIFIPRIEEYDLRNLDDIVKIYQIAKANFSEGLRKTIEWYKILRKDK